MQRQLERKVQSKRKKIGRTEPGKERMLFSGDKLGDFFKKCRCADSPQGKVDGPCLLRIKGSSKPCRKKGGWRRKEKGCTTS